MSWFSRIFRKSKEALAPAVYSPAPDSGPEAAPEQTPMPAMAVESVSTRATPVLERAKNVVEADDLESENAWPVGKTIGELQTMPMSSWPGADIITGLTFHATLQLRTPLRVLLRHGEIHTDRAKPPPTIALEMWEGIWLQITKSFEEIACRPDSTEKDIQFWRRADAALAQKETVASDVGPVRMSEYLPFLLDIRRIIEAHDSTEHRIRKLREMLALSEWQHFVGRFGPSHISKSRGADWIIERFFPRFVNTIPKLTTSAVKELLQLGLVAPNRLAAASDAALLAIEGIGPAKLKVIRGACNGATDKTAEYSDFVQR